MDIVIIIIIFIITICCCSSLSGSSYYFYNQLSTKEPNNINSSKPTSNIPKATPNTAPNKPSNTSSNSSSNSPSKESNTPATTPKLEKVIIGSDKYIINDADGIKTGQYKNIPNATFGLNNNLTRWTITIILKSDNYKNSWQGLIGNMYNTQVTNGWGLWINPNGKLHFRIKDATWDLNNLGSLYNNHPYKILINLTRTGFSFRLTNLKYFTKEGVLIKTPSTSSNPSNSNEINTVASNENEDESLRRAILSSREYKKADPSAVFTSNFDIDSNVDDSTYSIPNSNIKIETNLGFITVGGWWENNNNEKFKGDINYLEFYKM
jgi:hypothetical protein